MINPINFNGLSNAARDFSLQQIGEHLYIFHLNGIPGTVEIYEGSALPGESIEQIKKCRREYQVWCLPEFAEEIITLDQRDQEASGGTVWHVLTRYGGKRQVSVAYIPRGSVNDAHSLPLEFELWRVHDQARGEERTLWESFSENATRIGNRAGQDEYLVITRVAVSKESSPEAPYAVPIGFAASQLAIEHRLRKEPFQWVISQQRKELINTILAVPGARLLTLPAAEGLGLHKDESVVFDWNHPKARVLRARYPGYWFDHRELKHKLTHAKIRDEYRAAFYCAWDRMASDGLMLTEASKFRELTKPRNLKYLALAFMQNQELFEYCNRMTAPGPYTSITPKHAWFDSCRNVCASAGSQ